MSESIATVRSVSGVVMLSGALPLHMLGVATWPSSVPAQIHYMVDDPFRNQEWIDAVVRAIGLSDGSVEVFDYPGDGHLFTDRSLADEFDAEQTEVLWERVIRFCDEVA